MHKETKIGACTDIKINRCCLFSLNRTLCHFSLYTSETIFLFLCFHELLFFVVLRSHQQCSRTTICRGSLASKGLRNHVVLGWERRDVWVKSACKAGTQSFELSLSRLSLLLVVFFFAN